MGELRFEHIHHSMKSEKFRMIIWAWDLEASLIRFAEAFDNQTIGPNKISIGQTQLKAPKVNSCGPNSPKVQINTPKSSL